MQLFGTQVLAKKADPDFDPDRDCIEIAVDKEGLMNFINEMLERLPVEDIGEQVIEPAVTPQQAKAAEYGAELVPSSEINPNQLSGAERSVWFDEEWERMHLLRKLGYAELAAKDAQKQITDFIHEKNKVSKGQFVATE